MFRGISCVYVNSLPVLCRLLSTFTLCMARKLASTHVEMGNDDLVQHNSKSKTNIDVSSISNWWSSIYFD